jgi:hypothetical protein
LSKRIRKIKKTIAGESGQAIGIVVKPLMGSIS